MRLLRQLFKLGFALRLRKTEVLPCPVQLAPVHFGRLGLRHGDNFVGVGRGSPVARQCNFAGMGMPVLIVALLCWPCIIMGCWLTGAYWLAWVATWGRLVDHRHWRIDGNHVFCGHHVLDQTAVYLQHIARSHRVG